MVAENKQYNVPKVMPKPAQEQGNVLLNTTTNNTVGGKRIYAFNTSMDYIEPPMMSRQQGL